MADPLTDAARHNIAEDAAHREYLELYPRAKERALQTVRMRRADDVFDVLADDLHAALGVHGERRLREAYQAGNPQKVGMIVMEALERIEDRLVSEDDLLREMRLMEDAA